MIMMRRRRLTLHIQQQSQCRLILKDMQKMAVVCMETAIESLEGMQSTVQNQLRDVDQELDQLATRKQGLLHQRDELAGHLQEKRQKLEAFRAVKFEDSVG
jgi:predicted  nucleic acid-binding Zn-ribbon protein